MGYLKIPNLYKDQTILLFKEAYALEKIHGTSAHLAISHDGINLAEVGYFSGGTQRDLFLSLFNEEALIKAFWELKLPADRKLIIFGEFYGGKEQGMSNTYGKTPKFIVFDVKIGEYWLNVPDAESIAKSFGLEFVDYVKTPTDIDTLDKLRDAPSVQAVRNGVSLNVCVGDKPRIDNPRPREGIVLRPLLEMTLNNGSRVIAKYKGKQFSETATHRKVTKLEDMEVLAEAEAIANEWVTPMRLTHVLGIIPNHGLEQMQDILRAMVADVIAESSGEIDWSKNEKGIKKAIARRTSKLYQEFLHNQLRSVA